MLRRLKGEARRRAQQGRGEGGGATAPQGHSREEPHKNKKTQGWLGPELQTWPKRGGVRRFLQLRTQKTQQEQCSLLKPHTRHQQNVLRSLEGFSDIVYFIVYFKVVFKTKHTEKRSLETDWLCVHRNTNTTRYVLVGLL